MTNFALGPSFAVLATAGIRILHFPCASQLVPRNLETCRESAEYGLKGQGRAHRILTLSQKARKDGPPARRIPTRPNFQELNVHWGKERDRTFFRTELRSYANPPPPCLFFPEPGTFALSPCKPYPQSLLTGSPKGKP